MLSSSPVAPDFAQARAETAVSPEDSAQNANPVGVIASIGAESPLDSAATVAMIQRDCEQAEMEMSHLSHPQKVRHFATFATFGCLTPRSNVPCPMSHVPCSPDGTFGDTMGHLSCHCSDFPPQHPWLPRFWPKTFQSVNAARHAVRAISNISTFM